MNGMWPGGCLNVLAACCFCLLSGMSLRAAPGRPELYLPPSRSSGHHECTENLEYPFPCRISVMPVTAWFKPQLAYQHAPSTRAHQKEERRSVSEKTKDRRQRTTVPAGSRLPACGRHNFDTSGFSARTTHLGECDLHFAIRCRILLRNIAADTTAYH
jgi:hypothetical protein